MITFSNAPYDWQYAMSLMPGSRGPIACRRGSWVVCGKAARRRRPPPPALVLVLTSPSARCWLALHAFAIIIIYVNPLVMISYIIRATALAAEVSSPDHLKSSLASGLFWTPRFNEKVLTFLGFRTITSNLCQCAVCE